MEFRYGFVQKGSSLSSNHQAHDWRHTDTVRNRTELFLSGAFKVLTIPTMDDVREYQIRLYKDDRSLAIIMLLSGVDQTEAKAEAYRMLVGELTEANIWCENELIDTVHSHRRIFSHSEEPTPIKHP